MGTLANIKDPHGTVCKEKSVFRDWDRIWWITNSNVSLMEMYGRCKHLTLISRINTTPESLKARHVFIFKHFSFYE